MNYEKRERIENMLSFVSASKLTEAINDIADQMLDEGFEYDDVKEYIQIYTDEILGI
jgi:hypothetical protein